MPWLFAGPVPAGGHPRCEARPATGRRAHPPGNTGSVLFPFPVGACGEPRSDRLENPGTGA